MPASPNRRESPAVAGKVNYLVSEGRDLLDMESHQDVAIINAEAFIGMVEEQQAA